MLNLIHIQLILNFISIQLTVDRAALTVLKHLIQSETAGKMTGGWWTGLSRSIMTSSGRAFGQSGIAAPAGFLHIRLTAPTELPWRQ